MNSFFRALKGELTEHIPVWFMRQAGRYMKEYMEIRHTMTIKEMCSDPDVTAKISYQPVENLGVDAAIIFSDILLPLESMGMNLDYVENTGPVLTPKKDISSLEQFSIGDFGYPLAESIHRFKSLHADTPLIGFTGGPLTLASYVIAGKSDRDLSITKAFAMKDPERFAEILKLTTGAVISLSKHQMSAGVDVIQIFDSWAGSLSPLQFDSLYRRFLEDIRSELHFPLIYFSTGTSGIVNELSAIGFNYLSLDWRTNLSSARNATGDSVGLQGNLDPVIAENSLEVSLKETEHILSGMRDKPDYIFNLGHGVLPATNPETLEKIVEAVHNFER